ncbi:MAG TPA: RNA 2',3'-cyclic phosphodiesterase [Polyangia bacterium]|jgi:2'-5' RNA ligase
MTESVRSFVAVPLPAQIQASVFAAARELARALPDIKWSRKVENLHITVKFLGPVAEERLAEIGAALAEALGSLPRFTIELRGMGAFPSPRKASVVWAGVEDAAHGLSAVADVVEGVGERFGFARERRPFTGHVTVGRSKGRGGVDAGRALDAFAGRAFGATTVDEVHVYESRLGGEGSTYVLRSRAALAAN